MNVMPCDNVVKLLMCCRGRREHRRLQHADTLRVPSFMRRLPSAMTTGEMRAVGLERGRTALISCPKLLARPCGAPFARSPDLPFAARIRGIPGFFV